jgi:ketosteroid isomerase-like protein
MSDDARHDLLHAIAAWDRAMIANDADAIGRYMAEDWTIVGPDGSVDGKRRFLELVRSGALTHDVMESHEVDARLYGDTAVVVARGISGGAYHGRPFHVVERVSSVFLRQDGRWRCVLTHLSRLDQPA